MGKEGRRRGKEEKGNGSKERRKEMKGNEGGKKGRGARKDTRE